MPKLMKSKWFTVAVTLLGGGAVAASAWIRGEHSKALQVVGLFLAIAIGLLVADRSKRLRRELYESDERSDAIGLFAGMWAGFALFIVIFVLSQVEFARGHSGEPYYWLSGLYYGLFVLFAVIHRVRH